MTRQVLVVEVLNGHVSLEPMPVKAYLGTGPLTPAGRPVLGHSNCSDLNDESARTASHVLENVISFLNLPELDGSPDLESARFLEAEFPSGFF